MNAVDRFSSTLARYRQLPQVAPAGVQSVQPQALVVPAPVQARPDSRSDLDRALDKVSEATPLLSRLAALVNRVQNPNAAVQATSLYPGIPPIAPQPGPLGQSLQRLGAAVGDKGVDQFVRQAAPVIDDAIPLIEGVVNLFSGNAPRPAVSNPYQASTYPNPQPSISQQVAPMVEGVTSLVSGVASLANAIGGLFKR